MNIKAGMEKLMKTGKNIIDGELCDVFADTAEGMSIASLFEEFSEHDLIRNRIADPPVFEPNPPEQSNEMVVISHDHDVPPRPENPGVSSKWMFGFNPLSFLQKSDSNRRSDEDGNDAESGIEGTGVSDNSANPTKPSNDKSE